MRKLSLFLIILFLPVLLACQRTETTTTDTAVGTAMDTTEAPMDTMMHDTAGMPPGTGTMMTRGTADTAGGAAAGQEGSVHVTLADYRIEMPATLPAGSTMFHVVNNGQNEHNFEVEGQGIETKLDSNLQPGQSGMLTVDLKPGTYTVYCPVGNHADRGMSRQLTVQ